ncbi:MAG: agmatine deiminase family protein [Bacteroidota bacterium]
MKYLVLFLAIITVSCASKIEKKEAEYTYPPEWAPHEAIWTDFNYESYSGVPSEEERLILIAKLSQYVKTKVVYDNDSLMQVGRNRLVEFGGKVDSIEWIKLPYWSSWMRDPLMFVTNGHQNKILDFEWSCYGNANAYGGCQDDLRGNLSNTLQELFQYKKDSTGLFFEGGALEVSSNTILAYKALATQRNPDRSLEQVEQILLDKLGKEQIIWLEIHPTIDQPLFKVDNYIGNGANGHIDVTTRFLNDTTILATIISEKDKDKNALLNHDYKVLQKGLEQLKKAKQPNGNSYHIETIEAPDYSLYIFPWVMTEDVYYGMLDETSRRQIAIGDSVVWVPALEYANFTITNGVVIASEYWKEGMPESEKRKDERLKSLLQKYFPDRKIFCYDALPINWGGGGVHCRTQQEPRID